MKKIKAMLKRWLGMDDLLNILLNNAETLENFLSANSANIALVEKLMSEFENKINIDKDFLKEELEKTKDAVAFHSKEICSNEKKIYECENKININRNTLKNIVNISTNVDHVEEGRDESWAVISIGGKCQFVKYVNLERKDMREIVQFLRRYEAGNHIIDTRHKEVFEQGLYYYTKDSQIL